MKKKLLLIGLGVLAMSAGCGKREDDPVHILESRVDREGEEMGDVPSETASSETGDSQPDRDSQQESRQDSVSVPAEQEEGTPKPERGQTEAAGFSFGDLADWYFYFGSGVGAWSTELRIGSDGSFTGSYHDADMGDIGEGYPGGTYYFCGFEGSFKDLERVDRYTYKMKRDTLTYQEEPGTRDRKRKLRTRFSGFTPKPRDWSRGKNIISTFPERNWPVCRNSICNGWGITTRKVFRGKHSLFTESIILRRKSVFPVTNIKNRAWRKGLRWKFPLRWIQENSWRQS